MADTESHLCYLAKIARKDSGIANGADALELISLLILVRVCYEKCVVAQNDVYGVLGFENLFFNERDSARISGRPDYVRLNDALGKVLSCDFDRVGYVGFESAEKNSILVLLDKLKEFSRSIPFKIKSDKILYFLVKELSAIEIGLPLGRDYTKLVSSTAQDSISFGAHVTPKVLVDAIVEVMSPSIKEKVYDPALGVGSFLLSSSNYYIERSEVGEVLRVSGIDRSALAGLIATLNLLLNGVDPSYVSIGDALNDSGGGSYDVIMSHLPIGKVNRLDQHGDHTTEGCPSLEFALLKHIMEKLADAGRAAVVLPKSVLFNSAEPWVRLRRELLHGFNLHSVLMLPSGLFAPYTSAQFCVLFFDGCGSSGDVWFYDISERSASRQAISEGVVSGFVSLFDQRVESENSYLIGKEVILSDDCVSLYRRPVKKVDRISKESFSSSLSAIEKDKESLDILYAELLSLMREVDDVSTEFSEKVSLGNLLSTRSGKAIKKSQIADKGLYPVYGANGIMGYYDEFNVVGESVLIGRVGAKCGNVQFVSESIWFTNNVFRVEVTSRRVFKKYLVHLLRGANLNQYARGSAQPSISYTAIKDVEVLLPSYENQIKISELFDCIESTKKRLLDLFASQSNQVDAMVDDAIRIGVSG